MKHSKNCNVKWFTGVIWAGIIFNMVFALPACFAPDQLQSMLPLAPTEPTTWLRNVGMLLVAISVLYIPAAHDPLRYRIYAILAVAARFFAAAFWTYMWFGAGLGKGVAILLFGDLGTGIIQAFFLYRVLSSENKPQS
jgi:hypothetical protein